MPVSAKAFLVVAIVVHSHMILRIRTFLYIAVSCGEMLRTGGEIYYLYYFGAPIEQNQWSIPPYVLDRYA